MKRLFDVKKIFVVLLFICCLHRFLKQPRNRKSVGLNDATLQNDRPYIRMKHANEAEETQLSRVSSCSCVRGCFLLSFFRPVSFSWINATVLTTRTPFCCIYSWVLFFWDYCGKKESLQIPLSSFFLLRDSYQCVLSSQESVVECVASWVLGSKGGWVIIVNVRCGRSSCF